LPGKLVDTSKFGTYHHKHLRQRRAPDDIIPFWQAVVHGNVLNLRGLKFSVLALGNTTYDHFCRCGREFDLALERHGAMRIYPRVDCDVDYEEPVKRWIEGVLTALQRPQTA
jgi:sulfite reductase (NADPH) flavoprotein alpha-component